MKKLSEIKIGNTFKGNDRVERILLDLFDDGTALTITKDIICNLAFSEENNDYSKSAIHKMLSEKAEKLKKTFGAENVIKSKADLLSLNGSDAYGSIETEYRLMTFDEARKYMPILRNYIIQGTWWLATPCYVDNTTNNPVCCISNDLVIGFLSYHSYGVRPVCLLNSEIFVMDVKEENDAPKNKNDCRGKTLIGEKWVYGSLIDNAFYKKTANPLSPIISIPYIFCPNKEFCSWDEIVEEYDIFEVVPESVGRFTGFTDKNGKKIFEGDIVQYSTYDDFDCQSIVKFGEYKQDGSDGEYKASDCLGFYVEVDNFTCPDWRDNEPERFHDYLKQQSLAEIASQCEIIGNTYDNPELLEVER